MQWQDTDYDTHPKSAGKARRFTTTNREKRIHAHIASFATYMQNRQYT